MNDTLFSERKRLGMLLGAETDAEAAEFEAVAASSLAVLAMPVTPAAHLREELFARLDERPPSMHDSAERHVAPRGRRHNRRRGLRSRRLAVTGALTVIALLVVGGIGVGVASQTLQDHAQVRALDAVSAASDVHHSSTTLASGTARVELVSSVSLGRSIAVISNAPKAMAGHTYELWFYRDGKATAAGTFEPASSKTIVELKGRFRMNDMVAATLETVPTPAAPTTLPVFELPA